MATVKEIQDDYNKQIENLNLLLTKVPGGLNEELKNTINNSNRVYIEKIINDLKARGFWEYTPDLPGGIKTFGNPLRDLNGNFAWIDSNGVQWYGSDGSDAWNNSKLFLTSNYLAERTTNAKIKEINLKILGVQKALDTYNTSLSKTPEAIQTLATINNNAEIELKKLQTKRIIFIILGVIAIGLVIFFIVKAKKKNA